MYAPCTGEKPFKIPITEIEKAAAEIQTLIQWIKSSGRFIALITSVMNDRQIVLNAFEISNLIVHLSEFVLL